MFPINARKNAAPEEKIFKIQFLKVVCVFVKLKNIYGGC